MKKVSIILFIVIGTFGSVMSQNVLDGIYVKEHVPARKPIPYYHLREADVSWSKVVWRLLDLKEKQNHSLYYPKEPTDDRVSLTQLLVDGVQNEGITVYKFDLQNEFGETLTRDEMLIGLGVDTTESEEMDPITGEFTTNIAIGSPRPDEVKRMLMKEEWVFDKQRARMENRIIGLCPVRYFVKGGDAVSEDEQALTAKTLFWAYFPAYRPLFAKQEVFNPSNDAERRTFEDIFFKRKFASHIYRVTNVFDNRQLMDYKTGEDLLLEAEKIKDWMFKFEHDLWEM